jgi:hypothetical protein
MRTRHRIAIALLLAAGIPGVAAADPYPFTAVLEIEASVGMDPEPFELLSVQRSGVAEIQAGVVTLPAGLLSVAVPGLAGFGGTLVNGPGSFSAGGAGAGSTCSLIETQEVCIAGGGFGGVMALDGVTHESQSLAVWGVGGSSVGATPGGVPRTVEGTRWTQGAASAWYYVPELDPTPFVLDGVGTFRGLPGTHMGPGVPGFSLVTPMVVTTRIPTSEGNARAVARLRIDFGPIAVPTAGGGVLAALLALAGVVALASARSRDA